MKLKNKKTGEIKECVVIPIDSNGYPNEYQEFEKSDSLAELNAEWEDYNPKVFYYINENGGVLQYIPFDPEGEDETYIKYQKEIGNYFKTKEEAEKAVEKLKSWKRLKDKGFRFVGWYDSVSDNNPDNVLFKLDEDVWETDNCDDLDLLFGGEK